MTDEPEQITIVLFGRELKLIYNKEGYYRGAYTDADCMLSLDIDQSTTLPEYKNRISSSGPWYDDSDPEGRGATLQEAVENFQNQVIEIKRWVEQFLPNGT